MSSWPQTSVPDRLRRGRRTGVVRAMVPGGPEAPGRRRPARGTSPARGPRADATPSPGPRARATGIGRRLAITAVRTSSTRSRAPAEPAPRLNPPRPYLRAALARRPRPGRSGKSRPWTARSPRVGSSLPARGLRPCGELISAAAVGASADLATGSRRCGAATPVGRSIHAIPSGVQLTATVDGNPAVSSPTSPDAARHDSHVTDLRGRQPTHCLALRIRRLGVRVPPERAPSSQVSGGPRYR